MGLGAEIRVLHVDDEEHFLALSEKLLEDTSENISLITESHPDDALEILETHDIDCIISDYQMGGYTGLDLLQNIRDDYPELPFILFTGRGTEEIASEAITDGVDDYLQKGGGKDQFGVLAKRVSNLVFRRRAEAAYSEVFNHAPVGMAIHDPVSGEVIDANERWKELLGIDGDVDNVDMTTVLIEEPPYTSDTAKELIKKAADGDTQRFKWVAEKNNGKEVPLLVSMREVEVGEIKRVLSCTMNIHDADLLER